ncbi:MAG: low specificity L-threonine aldolase [Kiloniellaceae bacterium]
MTAPAAEFAANFASDNVSGVCPEILEAIARANAGSAMPYGEDEITRRLEAQVAEIFEHEVAVFPLATGSAANSLALSALVPRYGAIYCHREAHVNVDECGAPEFFTGGAKLVPLEGPHAKIDAATVAAAVSGAGVVHHVQPAAVSITQASEQGTVYTPQEVAALAAVAREHGLALHMDGARFANALARLGCTPAEASWKAGVDVLTLGATKNGALAAEAAIFFRPEQAADFGFLRKRGGHLFSKMRFVSAQLEAYLTGDLWLRNAMHANAQATRLAEGLAALPGVELTAPVEANEVFAALPRALVEGLQARGFVFYVWRDAGPKPLVRFVTAFDTRAADVAALLAEAARLAGVGAGADQR